MKRSSPLTWLKIFTFLAILVSIYLAAQHYSPNESKFCQWSATLDCNIVNKSPYSTVDGILYLLSFEYGLNTPYIDIPIPNAVLSILLFLFVFGALFSLEKKGTYFGMNVTRTITVLRTLLWISLIYAAYLFFIEVSVLKAYCPFCIVLDILIILILILLYRVPFSHPLHLPRRKP